MEQHFPGVTPQERFQNNMLNELRKLNANMEKLIGHHAQMPETKPKPIGREVSNGRTNRMAKGQRSS